MTFKGEIEDGFEDGPPKTTHFVQWDLGYPRQDPGLYEKKWHQLENRLFDLLDAGLPLTISAEGKKLCAARRRCATVAAALPEDLLTVRA